MSTIDARLQWIIDNLRQPDGLPWNQKALARAMELPSPAHMGMVVRGDVEDPRGSFLSALVRVTGVNGTWLLTGEGSPLPEPHAPAVDLSDKPLWRNLPNWRELSASAMVMEPTMPPWVWDRIGAGAPLLSAPPTPAMLAELAKFVLHHEPPPPSPKPTTGVVKARPKKKGG